VLDPKESSLTESPAHVESASPRLVVNRGEGGRVLSNLNAELRACTHFRFYVAFVNNAGVASLKQSLLDAEQRNVSGRVLVSQYLNFSDPNALRDLLRLSNLDVRIATTGNVHAKGYFFSNSTTERFLIGSSNWTAAALSTNTELNVQIESHLRTLLTEQVREEFDFQFGKATPLSKEWIDEYEQLYLKTKASRESLLAGGSASPVSDSTETPRPNRMQAEALQSMQALRDAGKTKALVVSATGTGKTFLSAFDARNTGARRLLFVVHRENIARKAMESFQEIFGDTRTYSVYSGLEKDSKGDFVFSTVQTLSRTDNLHVFPPDHFDYIIVDESHRAGAKSYVAFLNYFETRFLLGMTATPERTDGQDIFKYFDHNIAYEIRLQRALEEEMLCPFHYYGISDLTINGESVEQVTDFNQLLAAERVERIIEQAAIYGCHDGVVRGLVFCSRNEESAGLSASFNERGFRTVALSGPTPEREREQAIQRLESTDPILKLDYIFTVDIFNEGVDIPTVNQIIMLRPTQSAIVFVQQLGRGMRKVEDEEKYLTVIDFIGNYQNNYLIPIALYGDTSNDKDRIRRLVVGESEGIPGTSTVNFDIISKDRIFDSINAAKLQLKRDLCADYEALKCRLGQIPTMMDFVNHGSRDPRAYEEYFKSYYNFVREQEPDKIAELEGMPSDVLVFLAKDALNGGTCTEPILIETLLATESVSVQEFKESFFEKTAYSATDKSITSAVRSVNLQFMRVNVGGSLLSAGDKLDIKLIEREGDQLKRTAQFEELLANSTFRDFLTDSVFYSLGSFLDGFDPTAVVDGFVRYRKYSRADVFQILGFNENPVPQNVGGYLIAKDKSSCPIFVTYHKSDTISDTTKYEDSFKSPSCMHYFSKSNRSFESPDVIFFRTCKYPQRLPLFVQKNNDEGISFYYLGDVEPVAESFREDTMPNGTPVVRMDLTLDVPVNAPLYEYLTG
jgi:superfamily II DNA or RNA helicase